MEKLDAYNICKCKCFVSLKLSHNNNPCAIKNTNWICIYISEITNWIASVCCHQYNLLCYWRELMLSFLFCIIENLKTVFAVAFERFSAGNIKKIIILQHRDVVTFPCIHWMSEEFFHCTRREKTFLVRFFFFYINQNSIAQPNLKICWILLNERNIENIICFII